MSHPNAFAVWLSEALELAGLTAADLERQTTLEPGHVTAVVNGWAPIPDHQTIRQIAFVLKVRIVPPYLAAGILLEEDFDPPEKPPPAEPWPPASDATHLPR